jgi:hypothetical protein
MEQIKSQEAMSSPAGPEGSANGFDHEVIAIASSHVADLSY